MGFYQDKLSKENQLSLKNPPTKAQAVEWRDHECTQHLIAALEAALLYTADAISDIEEKAFSKTKGYVISMQGTLDIIKLMGEDEDEKN